MIDRLQLCGPSETILNVTNNTNVIVYISVSIKDFIRNYHRALFFVSGFDIGCIGFLIQALTLIIATFGFYSDFFITFDRSNWRRIVVGH